jgi:NADH-quinone oxidoreductase subunit G/[NiFe] hydrogenase diaphorase moiety small subunit
MPVTDRDRLTAGAQICAEFLTDGPCGHTSHALLHTSYTARGKQIPQPRD